MNDYLLVHFSKNASNDLKVRMVNGKSLPDWEKGPSYDQYMERLSGEGWHLLSSYPEAGSPGFYIFKKNGGTSRKGTRSDR